MLCAIICHRVVVLKYLLRLSQGSKTSKAVVCGVFLFCWWLLAHGSFGLGFVFVL